jgi:cation transport regulator
MGDEWRYPDQRSLAMPYKAINDLPDSVRNHVPTHAQEIYKEAFNHAWNEYADKDERRGDESREEAAHKVAWAAVKKQYSKGSDGNWHAR